MEEDAGCGEKFGLPFSKHRRGEQEPTLHLYVANCGPAMGLSSCAIKEAFASFGDVTGIQAAGDSGTRVVISFGKVEDSVAVIEAWSGKPCDRLQGRVVYMQYSVPRSSPISAIDGSGPTQHLESIRAIHRLLGQIQKLERPFVIQPNSTDISARLKVLEDWLQLQGVPQKFEKGQLLCTVPTHAMMTTATAIRSKDDVGILYKADPILRQMPTLILALHLLFEKHRPSEEPSNWAGYIQSLPGQGSPSESNSDNIDNFIMPLAFSESNLQGGNLYVHFTGS